MYNRLKSTFAVVLKVAVALVVVYLLLLVPRYEKYRKSRVDFTIDLPPLTAYAWPHAYAIGDSIELFVHAEGDYQATVLRAGDGKFLPVDSFTGQPIVQDGKYELQSGHSWKVTHRIPTAGWEPGYYSITLRLNAEDAQEYSVPILLRSATGNQVLVVAPTNTWQAYNTYGGLSNYEDRVTPKDLSLLFSLLKRASPGLVPYTYLPVHRPFAHPFATASPAKEDVSLMNGKISSDLYLIGYLERLGIDYGVISDRAFENGVGLDNGSLIIFNNHSEYWSYAGIGMLKQHLNDGQSVAFLSGNNMYREVEAVTDKSLIVMEQLLPRLAAEPILGTFYSGSGYQTYGSFTVSWANSWVFNGTGLTNGDTFGSEVISGLETDKLGPYSEGFTLLATGTNASGPAHMVIKEFPGGNFLFNASSVSSVRAIPSDTSWRRMIHNLIDKSDHAYR